MTDDPKQNPAPAAPGASPARPARMRPWLRAVFALSLALNLLVVGIVGGFALFHGPGEHGRPPRVDRFGGPLTGALTHEDRKAIGRQIWQSYREGRPSREEMRAEYAAVVQALRSEPFDATTVESSLKRQFDMATERQRIGQQALIARLKAMTPEERNAFADRLEEGLSRERHRRD